MHGEESNVDTLRDASVQRAQRCSACGGLNPPQAQWCGQCLARFEQSSPPPPPVAETPAADHVSDGLPDPDLVAPKPRAVSPGTQPAQGVPFEVTDQGITWKCSICDAVNPLEHSTCEVCSAPFAKTVLPEEVKPARDPNMAAMVSLFMPGAGHAYLGLWGQAIARAVVSLWVIMVVFVAALQRGAASSNLVMGVFSVVAIAFWAVAAHDAYREAKSEQSAVILKNKVFFYGVLGLLVLLVALLMSAVIKAQGN